MFIAIASDSYKDGEIQTVVCQFLIGTVKREGKGTPDNESQLQCQFLIGTVKHFLDVEKEKVDSLKVSIPYRYGKTI